MFGSADKKNNKIPFRAQPWLGWINQVISYEILHPSESVFASIRTIKFTPKDYLVICLLP